MFQNLALSLALIGDVGLGEPLPFARESHLEYVLKSGQANQFLVDDSLRLSLPEPPKKIVVAAAQAVKKAPVAAPEHLEGWFQEYGQAFNVDPEKLKRMANCESHYNPGAVSASGAYGGMFQYSASTWDSTRKAMGADPNPDLRFDAQQSILTTAWKISVGGIGAWPVCGQR
jgi:soluble lytic murein transglycosylase-like protein